VRRPARLGKPPFGGSRRRARVAQARDRTAARRRLRGAL